MRTILHADMNNFFATVECREHPEYDGRPVAVGGDIASRHGIILAKNEMAKKFGVRTGEAVWQAAQKCPGLVTLPAHFEKYEKASRLARSVYGQYTDQIESFGLDEMWLDITHSAHLFGTGQEVADTLRRRIRRELGLTISVGVSWNKVFAKLGSDMKKPDATTVITPENFKQSVWPLPVGELLYVGPSTQNRLRQRGVYTIGELANTPVEWLRLWLGQWGQTLSAYARGEESAPVGGAGAPVKSVGNSCTPPHDLEDEWAVKLLLQALSEKVAARLRAQGLGAQVVTVSVRDSGLNRYERQKKLLAPTQLSLDIARAAEELFRESYHWTRPVRSMGVQCGMLAPYTASGQISLFPEEETYRKRMVLERTMDDLRQRFGRHAVDRAMMLTDRPLNRQREHPNFFPSVVERREIWN